MNVSVSKVWNGNAVKIQGRKVVGKSIYETGLIVEAQAKSLCPVDQGRLSASITTQAIDKGTVPKGEGAVASDIIQKPTDPNEVLVGTPVEYGCVFGSHTSVCTENGMRTIGQIKEGDKVLTATGEFREVIKTFRYPVTEKNDLVTISAKWRTGYDHVLTVTSDHKLAIYREGRHIWIPACEIVDGDMVFRRIKKEKSKGTGRILICMECGGKFTGKQGKSFCSRKCRDINWNRGNNPHIGMKRTIESREKMSIAAKGRPVNHLAAYHRHNGGTQIELDVEKWLYDRGVAFEKQKVIGGNLFVDFYLPEQNEIIEADGAYWHKDQNRDIERDKRILSQLGDVKITHLHFYDKRWTPAIDPKPIKQVQYVVVNPSTKSFVSHDEFEAVPVKIRRWKWEKSIKKHASVIPMLFDLSVEGVHSFVASGLLISNSYIEFGTIKMDAQPFLRPALDLAKGRVLTVLEKNGRFEFAEYLQ